MRARLLRFVARIHAWFQSASLDRDFDDELDSHVQMLTDDNLRAGMSPAAARRDARIRLGATQSLAERHRRVRGLPVADAIWRDIRTVCRSLRTRPAHAAPLVLTLALGIGVVTALFSMLDSAVWHRVPFRDADRLVEVWSSDLRAHFIVGRSTQEQVLAWRRQVDLFDWVEAYGPAEVVSTIGPASHVVTGAVVTPDLFRRLGVAASLGRLFTGGDGQPGSDHRVLISDVFWKNQLQRDPAVVGKPITLDGADYAIVGVMPASFRFPSASTQLWVPYDVGSPHPPATAADRQSIAPTMVPLAHLKGLSFDEANAHVAARGDAVNAAAATPRPMGGVLEPFDRQTSETTRRVLLLLSGAGLLLLLTACVNVAALTLARDLARSPAIAVRAALGASRGALVRESLTHHLLIGALGAGAGAVVALGLLHAILRLLPTSLTDASLNPVGLDVRTLSFAAAAGLLSSVVSGLPSALSASGVPVIAVLHREGRTTASSRWGARVRAVLVGAQVCLSLVLLLGAGLMANTVLRLYRADRGFKPHGLVAVHVGFPRALYPDARTQQTFLTQARVTLRRLPGVEGAAIGVIPPFSLKIVMGPIEATGTSEIDNPMGLVATLYDVSPEYFPTMAIPFLAGRTFLENDPDDAVIVSAGFARRLWHSTSVAGRRFTARKVSHTVVGVVGDVRRVSATAGPDRPQVYYQSGRTWNGGLAVAVLGQSILAGEGSLVVRLDPSLINPDALVAAVSRIDPSVVARAETAESMIADETARSRVVFVLMTGFALLALAICAAGLYGLVSYIVEQRRREIGIRLALGERPATIGRRVIGRTLVLAVVSILVGLGAATMLIGLLRTELYGVTPWDPATMIGVAAILAVTALAGAALPARRAMRTDPATLLRGE
jgi:putative ABC transport system permease protein